MVYFERLIRRENYQGADYIKAIFCSFRSKQVSNLLETAASQITASQIFSVKLKVVMESEQ